MSLPKTCPKLYQESEGGNFVVQISSRHFSRIHHDQLKSANGFCEACRWWVTEKVGDCRAWNRQIFRANRVQNTLRYQPKWHSSPQCCFQERLQYSSWKFVPNQSILEGFIHQGWNRQHKVFKGGPSKICGR